MFSGLDFALVFLTPRDHYAEDGFEQAGYARGVRVLGKFLHDVAATFRADFPEETVPARVQNAQESIADQEHRQHIEESSYHTNISSQGRLPDV